MATNRILAKSLTRLRSYRRALVLLITGTTLTVVLNAVTLVRVLLNGKKLNLVKMVRAVVLVRVRMIVLLFTFALMYCLALMEAHRITQTYY